MLRPRFANIVDSIDRDAAEGYLRVNKAEDDPAAAYEIFARRRIAELLGYQFTGSIYGDGNTQTLRIDSVDEVIAGSDRALAFERAPVASPTRDAGQALPPEI